MSGAAVHSIKRMRLLDGCVATAVSDAAGHVCKLSQGSFCSAVTWPRSLLVQLGSDLSVPNHSGQACNSLPMFDLPV